MKIVPALNVIPEALPASGAWTTFEIGQSEPVDLEGSRDVAFFVDYDPNNSSSNSAVTLNIEWSMDRNYWYPTAVAKQGSFSAGSDSTDMIQRRLFSFNPTQDDNTETWPIFFSKVPYKYCRVSAKETGDTANPGLIAVTVGLGYTVAECCSTGVYKYHEVLSSTLADGDYGDIVLSSSGTVWTVDSAAITLAKMANLAQDQFIVRTTASTGVPQTATCTAAARTVLDDTTVAAMRTTLGVAGYSQQLISSAVNPADSTTYYPSQANLTNWVTEGFQRIFIPLAGTITRIDVTIGGVASAGAETSTISLRLNNTTDTTISSAVVNNAPPFTASAAVSIAVVAGDYWEIKWATPAWATTNPTIVCVSASIYVSV